jgi:F0F1-type ATP synthase assembly protein I
MGDSKSDVNVVSSNVSSLGDDGRDLVSENFDKKGSSTGVRTESYMTNQEMISAFIDLSWKMALALVVPLFIGSRIDNASGSSPDYTIAGLVFGLIGSGVLIYGSYKKIQADIESKVKSDGKGR